MNNNQTILNTDFQTKLVKLLDTQALPTNINKYLISEHLTMVLLSLIDFVGDIEIDKTREELAKAETKIGDVIDILK